jgi:hypothetical protein
VTLSTVQHDRVTQLWYSTKLVDLRVGSRFVDFSPIILFAFMLMCIFMFVLMFMFMFIFVFVLMFVFVFVFVIIHDTRPSPPGESGFVSVSLYVTTARHSTRTWFDLFSIRFVLVPVKGLSLLK